MIYVTRELIAQWIVETWADKHEYTDLVLEPEKINVEHVLKSREIGNLLRALNPITPDEVDLIIMELYGDKTPYSVTSTPQCSECDLFDGGPRIILHEKTTPWFAETYDEYTGAAICPTCAKKIHARLA